MARNPEYLDVLDANLVVQTEEKIVEVQQVQIIERVVEVLQVQCQEVIRHVTAPQVQEVIRQVTILSQWCLSLTSDLTECELADSNTGYGGNSSTMLSKTCAPQTDQPNARQQVD